jgi:hypothetical protein
MYPFLRRLQCCWRVQWPAQCGRQGMGGKSRIVDQSGGGGGSRLGMVVLAQTLPDHGMAARFCSERRFLLPARIRGGSIEFARNCAIKSSGNAAPRTDSRP